MPLKTNVAKTINFRKIIGGFCMIFLFSVLSTKAQSKSSRPNILIILTDDQGYHDVSYYGTEDIRTPNMDELVKEGMRFDNFYANCSVSSPTRAALLTGRYQDYVGVPGVIRTHPENSWGYLDPDATLLSSVLKHNGYHTSIIGKWHLGLESPNLPNDRGFDHFHGWLGDMMDDYWSHRRHGINYMRLNKETIDPRGHATNLFTEWSVDYIHERAEYDRPFFLYLAYNAPHTPIQPPEEWLEKVQNREPDISESRAKLVALIEHLDHGIGEVVNALKETGEYKKTLIIFTSDNGGLLRVGANNGPLRDGKQSMYEGGLKVPAAMVWPGHIEKGSQTDHIALTMDIFPTVMEIIGAAYDGPTEGRSFLPVLMGNEPEETKRPLYFSRREGGTRYGGQTIQALRYGDWKLVHNSPYEPMELYNLKKDPREQNDLAEKRPGKFNELVDLMMEHIQKGGRVPWQNPKY